MDITDNLSIDASSILMMNFTTDDDFFNPINNSSINENDDFEELMKHIESTDDFIDSNNDLLSIANTDDILASDLQEPFNMTNVYQDQTTMDYLSKPDTNQYTVQNVQQLQSNQEMMVNNMNQNVMQSNEVSSLDEYVCVRTNRSSLN